MAVTTRLRCPSTHRVHYHQPTLQRFGIDTKALGELVRGHGLSGNDSVCEVLENHGARVLTEVAGAVEDILLKTFTGELPGVRQWVECAGLLWRVGQRRRGMVLTGLRTPGLRPRMQQAGSCDLHAHCCTHDWPVAGKDPQLRIRTAGLHPHGGSTLSP